MEPMPKCPPLASLNVCKNQENWDFEHLKLGVTRVWRLTQVPAILASCNDECFQNAKLWSTHSPKHVLGYLLHHATTETELQLTDAYDQLVNSWMELGCEYFEEIREDRKAYRACQRFSAKRQLDEEGHGDSIPSKAGRYKDDEVFSDTFQSWVGPAGVQWYLWQGIDPKNSPEQWVGWHKDSNATWWYTYGRDADGAAEQSTA